MADKVLEVLNKFNIKNNFLIVITAMATLVSCGENEGMESENAMLKKENDSLRAVLGSLDKKYIFDKVFVRHIPSPGNTNEVGSKYKGEFFFVGYNDEDVVLFDNDADFLEPDTLRVKRKSFGTYDFETTLASEKSFFYFKPLIRNKDAVKFGNLGYQGIIIKDINKVDY